MEPVTHILTGACLARAGFHRRAAYATAVMAIAAEFPDIDTLWTLRGPIAGFQHHRGITHTFVGLLFEAAFLVALTYLVHQWRTRSKDATRRWGALHHAPVRWGALYGFTLVALLSHILLDYTNNYGVRPFFPFDPKWYAASIVFIFDPLIFLLLLAGLLLPLLFRLIGQEISSGSKAVRGTAWARTALVAIGLVWCFRAYEHAQALSLAATQSLRAPAEPVAATIPPEGKGRGDMVPPRPLLLPRRSLAGPDPLNPFRWYVANDYGPAYELGTVDTHQDSFVSNRILSKPQPNQALLAAERSRLGKIYLDWAPMPWLMATSQEDATNEAQKNGQVVFLQDVRFMGGTPFLQRRSTPPLTGEVLLDAAGHVLAEGMDGRFGR